MLTITVNALGGTIDAGPHTRHRRRSSAAPAASSAARRCTYTGGAATASCTVTITSAVAGTTVVSATSDIPVSGQTITRTTNTAVNTAAGGSGNASKIWATARIRIAPNDANEIGQPHTFTVTVDQDTGSGFVGIQGAHVDFMLTDTTAPPRC